MSTQRLTLGGLSCVVEPNTGVAGLLLPDPSSDVRDPMPDLGGCCAALSLDELVWNRAIGEAAGVGLEPVGDEDGLPTYLDDHLPGHEPVVLALRMETPLRDHVSDAELMAAIDEVRVALIGR